MLSDDEFAEAHQAVLQQIAMLLVEALPADWDAAALELAGDPTRGDRPVALSIRRSGGAGGESRGVGDVVAPPDSLYAAARRLESLCRDQNRRWVKAVIVVADSGEDWDVRADFEYDRGYPTPRQ